MNLNDEGLRERLENKHRALSRLKTEKLRLKDEIHNMTIGLSKWKENTHQAK